MTSYRITRLNPKSGLVEQPYRDKDGLFVLANPAGGAQRHQARYAVKVSTTAEAFTYLEQGYPIRMTDGQSPPSLVSGKSLTILPVDIEDGDEGGLGSALSRNPIIAKDAVMNDLKKILCAQAGHIWLSASPEAATAFVGFGSEGSYPYANGEWKDVDLSRFKISDLMSRAYDYAYQSGEYWNFGLDGAEDIKAFREGIPSHDISGNGVGSDPTGLCWKISELAYARWALVDGDQLSIHELSLLGNMSESATRTSLNRDGYSTPDGTLPSDQAQRWLQGRRGFIPTRTDKTAKQDEVLYWSEIAFRDHGLAEGLRRLITDWRKTTAGLIAETAQVSPVFMDKLMQGRPELDLDALQRVGRVLDVNVPQFVGLAVQEALKNLAVDP